MKSFADGIKMKALDKLYSLLKLDFNLWSWITLIFAINHISKTIAVVESPELKYRIEEEVAAGTFIGDVVKDAGLASLYDSSTLHRLQFRFLKLQGLTSGFGGGFSIDNSTGIIRTQGRIDREEICGSNPICDMRTDVAVQPIEHFRIIRVTISIIDINDNWPVFSEPEQIIETLESGLIGNVLYQPEATDLDGPAFSVQAYKLFSDSDRFSLRAPDRKPDGTFDTKLVIAKSLDREVADKFNIQIVAIDGGFPPKTSSVALTIYVLDVNDNVPEFEQTSYEITVEENIPNGTYLIQVRAQDKDLNLNGAVLYYFDHQTMMMFGELFRIDNVTGEISTRGSLDYEQSHNYRLTVVARDRGVDSKPSTVEVVINIEDVNDNAPDITVDTLASEIGLAEIREDVPIGTFVGHVTVNDLDSGKNGKFRCALNDPSFQLLNMYEKEFQILTSMLLDREAKDEYNVTLTCRDNGLEPLTTMKEIRIKVGDVNDNAPEFSQESYRGDLIENNYVGASILTVLATDADIGPNGNITYSLSGDGVQSFHIDPHSGLITAAVIFDREQQEVIRFHVVSTDGGVDPKSSSALVVFTVFDVNDEAPIFSRAVYSFAVEENLPEGSEVGAVAAMDADSAIYGEVTYSIAQNTPHAALFHMDRKTGVLTTTTKLDREQEISYQLTALATDRGVPPKSASVNITIHIADQNDHAPVFDFPTDTNNTVQVSSRAPVGHIITRLRAHDLDFGRNAKVTFTVTSTSVTNREISVNESAEYLDLDSEWGTVMVGKDLSELNGFRFKLNLIAKDHGIEHRTSDPTHLIVIVNQSAPLFLGARRPGDGSGQGQGWLKSITQNLLIVIAIAVGSGIIVIILIIAIIMIRRQDRDKSSAQKYNCRAEAMKMLNKDEGCPKSPDGGDCSPGNERYVACGGRGKLAPSPESFREYKPVDLTMSSEGTQPENYYQQDHELNNSMMQSASTLSHNMNSTLPHHTRVQSPPQINNDPHCYSPKPQNKELEVERLLRALQRDNDAESENSGEGSNTDSGRGVSEEGEHLHHLHHTGRQQGVNFDNKPLNVTNNLSNFHENGGKQPLVPDGTYRRYDVNDFNPPPLLLTSQIPYSTSNDLGLVDPSRPIPPHHVNSFGSSSVLHRGYPENDAILQNMVNELSGYSTGTSPRTGNGCHRPHMSPHSSTLPHKGGASQGGMPGNFHQNQNSLQGKEYTTPECVQGRGWNQNYNQPPPHWSGNNCRGVGGTTPASQANQNWTPGTGPGSDYGTPYSCGDISDVLSAERTLNSLNRTPDYRRAPPYMVDGNTGSASTASTVPDPNDLCREIDELFFNNMRTSNL